MFFFLPSPFLVKLHSDHIKSFVTIQFCLLCMFGLSNMLFSPLLMFQSLPGWWAHEIGHHFWLFFFFCNLNNHIFVYLAKIIKLLFSCWFILVNVSVRACVCLHVYSVFQLYNFICCVILIACINACTFNQQKKLRHSFPLTEMI